MASIECCQLMTIAETAKKTGPSIKSPIANLLPKTSEATSFETPTFLSCQVGRNSCKAVFHGAPWNFKSDSQSTFPDYVETSVAVGQTAKLRLNQTLVTPDSNLLCLSIRMRHIIAIQPESVKSGALLQLIVPALSIHFRPTIGSSLVIPVETVADGRWILMQMTISGIQTPYDVIFQQDGPMTVSAVPVTIPAVVQLALEKLTLHNGNC